MLTAEEIFERFSADIDKRIKKLLGEFTPFIANVLGYYYGWVDESFHPIEGRKGKKLRPTLNLLVYEAISGSYMPTLPLATALELIHNYTLIHDDIEDRDIERRGRPTLWRIWGDSIALNAGDALHTLGFRSLYDLTLAPADKVLEIYGILAAASLKVCEGQHLDMSFEKTVDVTQDMYLDMIERKTAALIECSTYTGALLATQDQDLITAYKNFGRNLGLAFQIRDDYLNIWGDAKSLGKSQYSDLKKKKKTLPVIYTFGALGDRESTKLKDIYRCDEEEMRQMGIANVVGRSGQVNTKAYTAEMANHEEMSETEIAYVLERFGQVNAKAYTAEMVNRYVAEALAWLDKTAADNQAQTQLRILSSFLTGRNY